MTVVPAYGRDYKTKNAVMEAWNSNRDFLVSDFFDKYDGKPINLEDALKAGVRTVNIRYCHLTKLAVIAVQGRTNA
jgi:hypothetical protein